MPFGKTYKEIAELLLPKVVLDTSVCRDILRRSGYRPGMGAAGGDLGGLIPPGGDPGDVLWFTFSPGPTPVPPELWSPMWFKPSYLTHIADGGDPAHAHPVLGDNKGVVLYSFAARNPDYFETGSDTVTGTITSANDAMSRNEMLVWEDIPSGEFYYPFNVDWFVGRREITARGGQYLPREIKMRGSVLEGTPAANLRFKVSADASSWTTLVSADLAGGGPFTTGWLPFNENVAGDVYLGLFLNARSSISRLHMGPVEVLMRWGQRGTLVPTEFLP